MTVIESTQFGRVGAFKFWCQKVLPAVYDDSLSYYELLCKVMKWLEDITEVTNTQSDAIAELQEQLAEFMEGEFDSYIEEKVDEWFDENEPDIMSDIAALQAKFPIQTADIDSGVITTAKIADSAVTYDKIDMATKLKMIQRFEGADCIWRKIIWDNFAQHMDMQGGVVFEQNGTEYFAYITGTDATRYLEIVRLSDSYIVSTTSIVAGHYGVISYLDGVLYLPAYKITDNYYGYILPYDVTYPASPVLGTLISFDTSYDVSGISVYQENKFIIEGKTQDISLPSNYSGIYIFDVIENTYTWLFDFNRTESGLSPQPINYIPSLDLLANINNKNYALTFYDLSGNLVSVCHFKEEYDFITVGEIENVTMIGNDVYIGCYHRSAFDDSRSIHLFHYNIETSVGTSNEFISKEYDLFNITVDCVNGDLIPVFDDSITLQYPEDAFNVVRWMNEIGNAKVFLTFDGTFDCALFAHDLNCNVIFNSGCYFKRGIMFYNCDVLVDDFYVDTLETADAASTDLAAKTAQAFGRASSPDKRCYLSFINCNVKAQLIRSMAAVATMANIYSFRFVNCYAYLIATNLHEVYVQYSHIYHSGSTFTGTIDAYSKVETI